MSSSRKEYMSLGLYRREGGRGGNMEGQEAGGGRKTQTAGVVGDQC